jgi:7-cyano-7-deazaguanine synthase
MKAVAIVSGGMDSVTLAYYLKQISGADLHLLSFDYGQRHVKELGFAIDCAETLGASHDIVSMTQLGKLFEASGSVLVSDNEVPEGHYAEETMKATVVPNRNSIMLTIAVGVAVAEGADLVAAGMHAGDHFIYPDCRLEYFRQFSSAMHLANEGFWTGQMYAPFISMTKADIVKVGSQLGVDYSQTWSCYKGAVHHCGKCGTCVERIEAFELADVPDPTIYDL